MSETTTTTETTTTETTTTETTTTETNPSLDVFSPLEGAEFRRLFDMCRDEYHMKVKYTQELFLLKYMRDYGADTTNEFVRHCRGVIFEKDSSPLKPVCYPITG